MKKPTRKPPKKRPVKKSPARKPARETEGISKLGIIKMVLEDSSRVASVQIIGNQSREELFELFHGVHDKWVVSFPSSRTRPMGSMSPMNLMSPTSGGGSGGTVVVMMVKETAAAMDT